MKETELKLIAELMKDARRSDRDLAKAIGASQPTVSRLRTKLEKEGIVREYAMIPNFHKLGFEILALTFVKVKSVLDPDRVEKIHAFVNERMKTTPFDIIMIEKGMGLGYDAVLVSFHKDYSCFMDFRNALRIHHLQDNTTDSFLVDLSDTERYLPLTLSVVARHLQSSKEEKKE